MSEKTKQGVVRRRSALGTGTVSLLVIFTVLCFATLALLSLSAANNNQRIHRRGLGMTHSLAAAQAEAAEALAELDDELGALQQKSGSAEEYYTAAEAAARRLGYEVNAGHTILCIHTVDENNQLVTQLELLPPGSTLRYKIVAQYSSVTYDWQPGDEGQLWPGNE